MKGFLLDCLAGVLFTAMIILFLFGIDKQAAIDAACPVGHVAVHAGQTNAANLLAAAQDQRAEK